MLIKFYSDLHLEFSEGKFDFLPESRYDKDTLLLLAGDICLAKEPYNYISFLERCSEQFPEIIMIPGNHEHYRMDINDTIPRIKNDTVHLENFSIINNQSIVIGDTVIIGSTMWASMDNRDPLTIFDAEQNMNDYHEIYNGRYHGSYKKKKLMVFHTMDMFDISREFIFSEIRKHKDKKCVVMTHHAPSYESIDPKYRGTRSGAYASDISIDILDTSPKLWIHGHCHNSVDYMIGDTRVISNPYGYYPNQLNPLFQPNMLIEI